MKNGLRYSPIWVDRYRKERGFIIIPLTKNYHNDLVSVITPAYNCEQYIAETMESVLKQTYDQWEIIIVDDGSTDNTIEIVQRYQKNDPRIKLIQLPHNQGVAYARNMGLKCSSGRFVAFVDSDDLWTTNKLEKQLLFMKEKNIGFSFTQYRQFMNDSTHERHLIHVPQVVDYRQLLKGNVIGCLTVMIDREKIPKIFMPKERHEDYIAWLAILKQGFKAYGLQEDLARYRITETSLSANKGQSMMWTWNIYKNIEKLSYFQASYYFMHYIYRGIIKHYQQ